MFENWTTSSSWWCQSTVKFSFLAIDIKSTFSIFVRVPLRPFRDMNNGKKTGKYFAASVCVVSCDWFPYSSEIIIIMIIFLCINEPVRKSMNNRRRLMSLSAASVDHIQLVAYFLLFNEIEHSLAVGHGLEHAWATALPLECLSNLFGSLLLLLPPGGHVMADYIRITLISRRPWRFYSASKWISFNSKVTCQV